MKKELFTKLQDLQFELYVAKQIQDEDKQKSIKRKIRNIEKKIKKEGDE